MKRRSTVVENQLRNKFMSICTTGIVTETFIRALPFNKTEVKENLSEFTNYATNVCRALESETLLTRAIESTENSTQKAFLSDLKSDLSSIANDATRRIVNESNCCDDSNEDVVKNATLDKEEVKKLVDASAKNGVSSISKIIQDNIIDTIKKDKEAYEEEQKMRNEIKEVLKKEEIPDNESSDVSVESYLNYLLSPTDVRHPISLFSKLQDICMENLMYSPESNKEINSYILSKVTLESTFPYFNNKKSLQSELKDLSIAVEGMNEYNELNDNEKECKKKKIAKTAFICSIAIMTMLQTLKTMNLMKPSISDVRNVIDNPTKIDKIDENKFIPIEPEINKVTDTVKKQIAMGALNVLEANEAKESLLKIQSALENINISDSTNKFKLLEKLSTAIESTDEYINKSFSSTASEKPITSAFASRQKEANICALEVAVKRLARDPAVDHIQIDVDSKEKIGNAGTAYVQVYGMNAANIKVTSSSVVLEIVPEFGSTLAEVIRNIANYCDFGTKIVYLYFTDSGYRVPVKG